MAPYEKTQVPLAPILLAMTGASPENGGAGLVMTGFVIAAASSLSFLTIMGNPANSIIFASGQVSPPHFLRAGWKMTIISIGVIMLMAALYWPLVTGLIAGGGGR